MRTQVMRDANDVDLLIVGSGVSAPLPRQRILDLSLLKDQPKAVRLTQVFHAVETGIVVYIWWEEGEGDGSLLLPVEGKGVLNLESFGGIHNPRNPGWTGHVSASTKNITSGAKHFTIVLGFSKMRE